MPERAACDEAIQFSQVRLKKVPDDLRLGQVETFTVQNVMGSMSRPWGIEGGFAVVYRFRTQSGKIRALRCFRVPMHQDMHFRYEHISAYFAKHASNVSAEFNYYSDGILINERSSTGPSVKKPYPIVDMEWIEGMTLLEKVDELCVKGDRAGLGDLTLHWIKLVQMLHKVKIAHGDLSGGNVMVRSNGRLVLVDYDGVYIPDFAGLPGIVQGQPDYQHPDMEHRPFNETMDSFSALVIYTALLVLQIQPELWNRYTQKTSQGKVQDGGILFSKRDFADPNKSTLINEIEQMRDSRVKAALQILKNACLQPVAQITFPFHIIDPDYEKKQALRQLDLALTNDRDEEALHTWESSALDSYGPAKIHAPRIEQIKLQRQALQHFRTALQSGNIQQILAANSPLLQTNRNVTADECEHLAIAQEFDQAYSDDNDLALAAVGEKIRAHPFTLTTSESQRLNVARMRSVTLKSFRTVLKLGNIRNIVMVYNKTLLDTCKNVTQDERETYQLAREFVQAYDKNDEEAIVLISEKIQSGHSHLTFTQEESQRINEARQQIQALEKFRSVLGHKNLQLLASVDDSILNNGKSTTREERELVQKAKEFEQARKDDDDQTIAFIGAEIQGPSYQKFITLTPAEQQRIELAQQRKVALVKFRQALTSKRIEQIINAYDKVLSGCKNITDNERELFSLATDLIRAFQNHDDEELISVWDDIQHSRHHILLTLTDTERQHIELAHQRVEALRKFREELKYQGNNKRAEQIITAYNPILDNCQNVSAEERTLVQDAKRFIQKHQSVIDGLQKNNYEQITQAYDENLFQQFADFSQVQQDQIKKARKLMELEQMLDANNHRQAIVLAQEIELLWRQPNDDYRLKQAKRRFISQFNAQDVQAWLYGDEVIVRWRWPEDELVHYVVIIWRADKRPSRPRAEREYGTGQKWFSRDGNELTTLKQFWVGTYDQLYLSIYLAFPDDTNSPPVWYYSQGSVPSSHTIAYPYYVQNP